MNANPEVPDLRPPTSDLRTARSLERALLMRMLEDTLGLALAMAKTGDVTMARLELADAGEKLDQLEALGTSLPARAALALALEV